MQTHIESIEVFPLNKAVLFWNKSLIYIALSLRNTIKYEKSLWWFSWLNQIIEI